MKNATGRSLAALAWITLLAVLAACAPPAPMQNGSPQETKLKVIRINDFPFLSQAPLQIAVDEGYLAEEGLEVEWIPGSRTEDALPSLLTGDMDVMGTAPSVGVFSAAARGGKLAIVADKGIYDPQGCAYGALVARAGLLTPGSRPDATLVRGSKIAANPVGLSGYFLAEWLGSLGMTVDDVEVVNVPIPTAFEAVVSGGVDFAILTEPWLIRALETGGTNPGGRPEIAVDVADVVPGLNYGLIFYGPSLLEEDKEAGERFMRAYLKAIRRYQEGKTPANIATISKYTKLEPALVEAACWPVIDPELEVDLAALQKFADWSFAGEGEETAPDVQQLWDPAFLTSAKAAAGE